jgi:3-oxoadipate enol-lactonase
MSFINASRARISYIKTGIGPAVLLIQGAGVVGAGWRPQVEGLARSYTLFAFDNRGIGDSSLDRGADVTVEEMARDALAIMDAEGVERFHVVGHSMGGLIAQALALGATNRVKSLSLLGTFVRGIQGARLSPALTMTALRMRIGTRAMRSNAFLELIMPAAYLRAADRPRLAREMAPLFGYDLASQPSFVLQQVRAMARYDAAARWRELGAVPTLVASARHDRIALPEYGRALAALIDGARYVELPDAGHGMTIQCAEEVNAMLREHFAAADTSPAHSPAAARPMSGA